MSLKVIDLFAGCGGFSIGFIQNGLDIVKAVEFDESIVETYKHNHPETKLIVDDIKNVDNSMFFQYNEADIIIGGHLVRVFLWLERGFGKVLLMIREINYSDIILILSKLSNLKYSL